MFVLFAYLVPFLRVALLNGTIISTDVSVVVIKICTESKGLCTLQVHPFFELKIIV